VKNGDPKLGAVNTNAPHVFKDKVITGISGGEWGVRASWRPMTSTAASRSGRATASARRRNADRPRQDDDLDRRRRQARGCGLVDQELEGRPVEDRRGPLGWYSYDKALNAVFYGTGNPSTGTRHNAG